MVRRTWHTCQPMDLHRMARQYFMAAKRIELQKLARELGISRATAYRWAGSVEELIGEVLASLVEDTFGVLKEQNRDLKGTERVIEVLTRLTTAAHELPALRKFLRQNPEQGLKIVASAEGPVQARTITCITTLLQEEVDAGSLALEPDVTAAALVRLMESYLYTDLITGTEADTDASSEAIRLMLSSETA